MKKGPCEYFIPFSEISERAAAMIRKFVRKNIPYSIDEITIYEAVTVTAPEVPEDRWPYLTTAPYTVLSDGQKITFPCLDKKDQMDEYGIFFFPPSISVNNNYFLFFRSARQVQALYRGCTLYTSGDDIHLFGQKPVQVDKFRPPG